MQNRKTDTKLQYLSTESRKRTRRHPRETLNNQFIKIQKTKFAI